VNWASWARREPGPQRGGLLKGGLGKSQRSERGRDQKREIPQCLRPGTATESATAHLVSLWDGDVCVLDAGGGKQRRDPSFAKPSFAGISRSCGPASDAGGRALWGNDWLTAVWSGVAVACPPAPQSEQLQPLSRGGMLSPNQTGTESHPSQPESNSCDAGGLRGVSQPNPRCLELPGTSPSVICSRHCCPHIFDPEVNSLVRSVQQAECGPCGSGAQTTGDCLVSS
jgi:hypothetical protein